MKVVLLTREYPPEVYGGAGVHVEYLARELGRLASVEVRCFGRPRPADAGGGLSVRAFGPWDGFDRPALGGALGVVDVDLAMIEGLDHASIVHSHTWYTNLAGHMAKLVYGIPHVATTHSLEPLRPWKAEQLGEPGYRLSRFCERTGLEHADALISVSNAMRADVLSCYPAVDPARVHVISNGIDAGEYAPDPGTDALDRAGVDAGTPYVLFVGRVTRQKGLTHFLDGAELLPPPAQVVICAGAADTAELEAEVATRIERLSRLRPGIVWIRELAPRRDVIQLLSHAAVFCCPSVYEPFGIVNLEAMACEAPVVATDTGGIPDILEDGVTGLLVPFEPNADRTGPADPGRFARDLAERINMLLADPDRARRMGRAGRERVLERFTWSAVARRTFEIYRRLTRAEAT